MSRPIVKKKIEAKAGDEKRNDDGHKAGGDVSACFC